MGPGEQIWAYLATFWPTATNWSRNFEEMVAVVVVVVGEMRANPSTGGSVSLASSPVVVVVGPR